MKSNIFYQIGYDYYTPEMMYSMAVSQEQWSEHVEFYNSLEIKDQTLWRKGFNVARKNHMREVFSERIKKLLKVLDETGFDIWASDDGGFTVQNIPIDCEFDYILNELIGEMRNDT